MNNTTQILVKNATHNHPLNNTENAMIYDPLTAEKVVCYAPTMITTKGVWQGDDPLDYALSLFILQLLLIVVVTRILVFVLRPLRQPRIISHILGGVLLGPSCAGLSKEFARRVFPMRSMTVLETMANIGLLYFLFLVGVEMDLTIVRRTGRQALIISVVGMSLPFLIGVIASFVILKDIANKQNQGIYLIFLGVTLSVTAFPVLARILAELKLLNTELGKTSLSAAMVNDLCAWIFLSVAVALAEADDKKPETAVYVILAASAFVLFCIFVIRPTITWIIKRTPEGESFNDFYICLILTGVMICGLITDAIGTHSVLGAFIFGLIIPNGPLGTALLETLEDFVTTLLLPLFFAIIGLKTNIWNIKFSDVTTIYLTIAVIVASIAKFGGTLVLALLYEMPFTEGVCLGLLMNTKGLVEIIVLNVALDQEVIDNRSFSLLVIFIMLMTGITMPVIAAIYKPTKHFISYKYRTIQKSKTDAELRILVCVHTPRNVPSIINLIETSNPTKKSPICIYSVHLVELTGRASAMLIVHNARKGGRDAINRTQAQSEHISNSFETYAQHTGNVTIQPLTALSPYSTMHEDICNLAEDKRVNFIIVPFHKQKTVDGGMEEINPAFRNVNQNVLANAPCSIGILIDRSLGNPNHTTPNQICHHIVLLFFGGPDDREALAYACRMAEHPGVDLTVIRFLLRDDIVKPQTEETLTVSTDTKNQRKLDAEYIGNFRQKTLNNKKIVYKEKVVENGEDTIAVVRSIDSIHDLYIVGRGQGMVSPLTDGLTDWSECPELGTIGDLLASSDFATTVSVLVVQQYIGQGIQGDVGTPRSITDRTSYSNDNTWQ